MCFFVGKNKFFYFNNNYNFFKLMIKEDNIFKNKKFLFLLFSVVFMFIMLLLLPFFADIILGAYKNTIFSFDNLGFLIVMMTTLFTFLSLIFLPCSFIINIIYIIKKIINKK